MKSVTSSFLPSSVLVFRIVETGVDTSITSCSSLPISSRTAPMSSVIFLRIVPAAGVYTVRFAAGVSCTTLLMR